MQEADSTGEDEGRSGAAGGNGEDLEGQGTSGEWEPSAEEKALGREFARRLAGVLRTNAEGYDQRTWTHECGTPACIAGWAAWLAMGAQPGEGIQEHARIRSGCWEIREVARVSLGLGKEEAGEMFMPEPWVGWFATHGYRAPEAADAARMLEWYTYTGEVDWDRVW